MFIVIGIYAVRVITESIAITVCSCIVAPVVAHVVGVCAAVVGVQFANRDVTRRYVLPSLRVCP